MNQRSSLSLSLTSSLLYVTLFPLNAAPTLTLDLASPPSGTNITRVFGHGMDDDGIRGVPMCGGLDCDGDGHPDYAFAQFQGDPLGRTGAGEVTVIFGDSTIGGTTDAAVDQAGILRIAGEAPFETTGDEAWIDDVTGDGLGDLLIGRQNYTLDLPEPEDDRPGAGALSILIGDPDWKTQAATLNYLDLGAPPANLKVITFVGSYLYDRLGIWMRTGDITGDGIADILVGADEVDGPGQAVSHNQGAAYVIRGGPHLLDAPDIIDLADFGEADFPDVLKGHVACIDPPSGLTDGHFGATVQVADLDNNGRAEVMIAATLNRFGAGLRLPNAPGGTGESFGGTNDGTLYIVWDENFPPTLWQEDFRFAATNPPFGDYTAIDGDDTSRSFGEEILGGLDYSGDGFPELMVGDLAATALGRSFAGRGHIFYNAANLRGLDFDLQTPPASVVFTEISGPVAGAISSDTALHGDFDGDDIADIGIGNPHDSPLGRTDAGSVHILYGQAGGWPASIDLNPSNLPDPDEMRIALIQGANGTFGSDDGDTLCYSAADGDINGDGLPDLIINEMAGDGSGGSPEDVGNLLVVDASSLLAPFSPSLVFSPSGIIDFGVIQLGLGSSAEEIIITNNSIAASPVNLTSITIAGPSSGNFQITADTGETSLNSGNTRTISITATTSSVGRFGAALVIQTDFDAHPISLGLACRGVNDFAGEDLDSIVHLIGNNAFVEIPQSQFGVDYTLIRNQTLQSPASLYTIQGTGQTLYLPDLNARSNFSKMFYQIDAFR